MRKLNFARTSAGFLHLSELSHRVVLIECQHHLEKLKILQLYNFVSSPLSRRHSLARTGGPPQPQIRCPIDIRSFFPLTRREAGRERPQLVASKHLLATYLNKPRLPVATSPGPMASDLVLLASPRLPLDVVRQRTPSIGTLWSSEGKGPTLSSLASAAS